MNYIYVNPQTLELSLVEEIPEQSFVIPTQASKRHVDEPAFHHLVYFNVLYPYVENLHGSSDKPKVRYKLIYPEPWLMGVAALIWEGLIQGLTWDVIKGVVLQGIDRLRSEGLAPKSVLKKSSTEKETKFTMGVSWTEFSEDGQPLKELFCGIKREFDKRTEQERQKIDGRERSIRNSWDE